MFTDFDDSFEDYEIIFSDGTRHKCTAQELFEFYVMYEHGLKDSFEYFKDKLDKVKEVEASDYGYDWNLGTHVYRGKLIFKRIATDTWNKEWLAPVPPKINDANCKHKNKYINQAGGIKFWYCKDCKSDLGDA